MLEAIISPERNCSRVTPKYVTFDFDSMTFPLQITFNLTPVLNLLFVPNKIDCVLPRWRDNLLSISQLLTYSSSELNVDYISATFFPEEIKAESSAYNNSLHLTADAISSKRNRERCMNEQVCQGRKV